jgi:hypothetical protein
MIEPMQSAEGKLLARTYARCFLGLLVLIGDDRATFIVFAGALLLKAIKNRHRAGGSPVATSP